MAKDETINQGITSAIINNEGRIQSLEQEVRQLKEENSQLRSKLAIVTKNPSTSQHDLDHEPTVAVSPVDSVTMNETNNAASKDSGSSFGATARLDANQIERYSRQLLIKGGFGVDGQIKLAESSVLIVGAGGIGSTVILYLAACGVGKLSIIDFDQVDVSNLHRQVIHKTADVGMNKAESACKAVKALNPSIRCEVIKVPLTHQNAFDLVSQHTCVVDACDNPQTRYLVNDACVLAKKPLISGSAIGTEGQLSVYNFKGGPCYRCLYPVANTAEGGKSCTDNGVLGPVPGTIGMLQATETIKVITGVGRTMHDRLLMYDSLQCSFMSIKKPPKKLKCAVCGSQPTIQSMHDSHQISQTARGILCAYTPPLLEDGLSIACAEYAQIRRRGTPHILLDVRAKEQYDICSLPGSLHIPLARLNDESEALIEKAAAGKLQIYCLCRRGIFSASATESLNDAALAKHPGLHFVKNITGGLDAWRKQVDHDFPKY